MPHTSAASLPLIFTIVRLLSGLRCGKTGITPKHIVVELNEEILPKTEYDSTAIADGDVVEILSFMGGG